MEASEAFLEYTPARVGKETTRESVNMTGSPEDNSNESGFFHMDLFS